MAVVRLKTSRLLFKRCWENVVLLSCRPKRNMLMLYSNPFNFKYQVVIAASETIEIRELSHTPRLWDLMSWKPLEKKWWYRSKVSIRARNWLLDCRQSWKVHFHKVRNITRNILNFKENKMLQPTRWKLRLKPKLSNWIPTATKPKRSTVPRGIRNCQLTLGHSQQL